MVDDRNAYRLRMHPIQDSLCSQSRQEEVARRASSVYQGGKFEHTVSADCLLEEDSSLEGFLAQLLRVDEILIKVSDYSVRSVL